MTEIIRTRIAGAGGTSKLRLIPVQELPDAATAKQGAVYLVPDEDAEEGNLFKEYVVVDGAWELVGSAKIDLDKLAENFVTIVQEDAMASGYDVTKNVVFYRNGTPLQSYRADLGAHKIDFVEKEFAEGDNYYAISIAHNGVLKGTYEATPPDEVFYSASGEPVEDDATSAKVFGVPLSLLRSFTKNAVRRFNLDKGVLASLKTEDKSSLVAAINELVLANADLAERVKALEEKVGGVKAEYDEANKAVKFLSGATYDEENKAIILDGGTYDKANKSINL